MAAVVSTNVKVINEKKNRVIYYTGDVTDTQLSTYALYTSSAFVGVDTLTSSIISLKGHVDGVPGTGMIKVLWDATTDVTAWSLPVGQFFEFDFRSIGGLKNQGGSGKTGNIWLTSVGLPTSGTISLVMEVTNS